MSPGLPLAVLPRIGALLRLLGSDQDHEAIAAVKALQRTLTAVGADLHSLADAIEHPPTSVEPRDKLAPQRRSQPGSASPRDVELHPGHRRQVVEALTAASAKGALTTWELRFVASILPRLSSAQPRVSLRQREIIDRILGKTKASRP